MLAALAMLLTLWFRRRFLRRTRSLWHIVSVIGMVLIVLAIFVEPVDAQDVVSPNPAQPSGTNWFAGSLGILTRGGPMVLPLAICSFLLCLFAFERAISLRRGRVIPRPFVRRLIHQMAEGEIDEYEALERCRENQSPIAEVFAGAVIKAGRTSVEVEQAVIDGGERVASRLRRYLRLFNGIATISPLLGLLGTVMGMIKAFNSIASSNAMGRPELLASGISQALLTTAAGLSVAIPALIVYLFFSGRVDKLVMEIDMFGQELVNAIASDGWREKPKKKARRRAA